jgi:hypothetical protein
VSIRERILLKNTFKARTTVWNGPVGKYPKLPQIAEGFTVTRVDLLADGHMEIGEEVVSFQDIRIFAVEQ